MVKPSLIPVGNFLTVLNQIFKSMLPWIMALRCPLIKKDSVRKNNVSFKLSVGIGLISLGFDSRSRTITENQHGCFTRCAP